MKMIFRLGKEKDIEELISIYSKNKNELLKRNIFQWGNWNNGYPNEKFIKNSIDKEELFILSFKNKIIGSVVLNQEQSIEWNEIMWSGENNNSLVIHAMVIDPFQQGNGFGAKLLENCENYAKNQGYKYIRLDSFSKNKISNQLYITRNYNNLSFVTFDEKPKGNQKYYCYEKKL